ncbi:unnamed protein product [Leuciscus chuanchicus]
MVSNDTDTFALLLHYSPYFKELGMKEIWQQYGTVQHLANFGEADTLTEQDAALAEKYLVCVWAGARSTTTAKTFDDFRVEIYTSGSAGIDALPPTSSGIRAEATSNEGLFWFIRHATCLQQPRTPKQD